MLLTLIQNNFILVWKEAALCSVALTFFSQIEEKDQVFDTLLALTLLEMGEGGMI